MTGFMTSHPVLLAQSTCPGDQRAKGVQFQLTCNLCLESHKTQVWLCFLVLSFLSTSTCAAPGPATMYLQSCLNTKRLKDAIERSDAMMYAPSSNDVEHNNCLAKKAVVQLKRINLRQNSRFMWICERDQVAASKLEKCKMMSLRCYMLELMMVIIEEDIIDSKANCIFDFNENLPEANPVGCPRCETYSLKNITVFLERLNNLLQEMNSRKT